MKKVLFLLLFALPAFAQGAARPVILTWAPSTSTTVTQYSIYRCAVPSGSTSCTPTVTGVPLGTTTAAVTSYTDNPTVNVAYGYAIVANAPACTPTTPLSTPCGNSAPLVLSYVPVPPQTAGATNGAFGVP